MTCYKLLNVIVLDIVVPLYVRLVASLSHCTKSPHTLYKVVISNYIFTIGRVVFVFALPARGHYSY